MHRFWILQLPSARAFCQTGAISEHGVYKANWFCDQMEKIFNDRASLLYIMYPVLSIMCPIFLFISKAWCSTMCWGSVANYFNEMVCVTCEEIIMDPVLEVRFELLCFIAHGNVQWKFIYVRFRGIIKLDKRTFISHTPHTPPPGVKSVVYPVGKIRPMLTIFWSLWQ